MKCKRRLVMQERFGVGIAGYFRRAAINWLELARGLQERRQTIRFQAPILTGTGV